MPFKSESQRRLFYAAASGKLRNNKGPSPSVARKFISDSSREVTGKLPYHVKK